LPSEPHYLPPGFGGDVKKVEQASSPAWQIFGLGNSTAQPNQLLKSFKHT
jgi:hypothetical protein